MNRMRRSRLWRPVIRAAAVLGAATVFAAAGGPGAPLAAAVAQETISGSGSSWSYNAVQQWIADVRPQGTIVQFNRNGSGQGRADFAGNPGMVDFANSDIPYQIEDPLTRQPDTALSRPYAYIPIIAGGTALMYHLDGPGGKRIDTVRLSGETVAKIFTGVITNWSDPQITGDMNGHALPNKRIQVVFDSQGGGTTAQFTDWLVHQHGDLWQRFAGQNKPTSYFPGKGDNMSGAPGDDRISAQIASPNYDGAIGFVQYSYALSLNYPVAKVLNAAGFYTGPTPYNAAVALTQAYIEMNNHDPAVYLTQQLDKVYTNPDPRSYLLSSYSYMIMPTGGNDPRINEGKALTFANFSYYGLCEGQAKAFQQGYSPLPLNLVQAAFAQVPKFPHMNKEFQTNKDPSTCNNPTFDKADPSKNHLAEIDPAPQDCDKQGQGPCGAPADKLGGPGAAGGGGPGAGGGTGSGSDPNGANANGANPNGANPGTDPSGGTGPGANGSTPDGSTTPGVGANVPGGSSSAGAKSSELAAFRQQESLTTMLGVLAAIELVLVLLVPAFVGRALARRRAQRDGAS